MAGIPSFYGGTFTVTPPSTAGGGNFVQQVQQQSWYPQVKQIMNNQGVSDPVWIAELMVEDRNLDPKTVNPAGPAYGLFQLKTPGGLGDGYSLDQLKNPIQNAEVAGEWMGATIRHVGPSASLSQQVYALEDAGWPGDNSDDKVRQAALGTVIHDMGASATQAGVPNPGVGSQFQPYPITGSLGTGTNSGPTFSGAINAGVAGAAGNLNPLDPTGLLKVLSGFFPNLVNQAEQLAWIAAVILILIIGGLFLMVAPYIGSAAKEAE